MDSGDWKGMTPTMLAVRKGNYETVRALLGAGAWVSAVDKEGDTALMKGARHNQASTLDVMVKAMDVRFSGACSLGAYFGLRFAALPPGESQI